MQINCNCGVSLHTLRLLYASEFQLRFAQGGSPEMPMNCLTGLLPRRGFLKMLGPAATLSMAPTLVVSLGAQQAGKLDIVATTGMIADAVRQVRGERVNVEGLMGPGVDPHLYR